MVEKCSAGGKCSSVFTGRQIAENILHEEKIIMVLFYACDNTADGWMEPGKDTLCIL